jgi:hypothetical protein
VCFYLSKKTYLVIVTMSFTELRLIFKIGKTLAVTPSSLEVRTATSNEKMWAFTMILFYVVSVSVSYFYRTFSFIRYIHLELAIRTIVDGSLFTFNINTVVLSISKRTQWSVLIKNLKDTEHISKEKSSTKYFVIANLTFWTVMIFMSYVFTQRHSWDFYKKYAVEYVQLYVQFFITFLICSILRLFKSRYRSINHVLTRNISIIRKLDRQSFSKGFPLHFLRKIRYDLSVLKEAVDSFNNIFGWPIFLTMVFVNLQVLIYLESFFTNPKNFILTLSNILMALTFAVSKQRTRKWYHLFRMYVCSVKSSLLYYCVIQ